MSGLFDILRPVNTDISRLLGVIHGQDARLPVRDRRVQAELLPDGSRHNSTVWSWVIAASHERGTPVGVVHGQDTHLPVRDRRIQAEPNIPRPINIPRPVSPTFRALSTFCALRHSHFAPFGTEISRLLGVVHGQDAHLPVRDRRIQAEPLRR